MGDTIHIRIPPYDRDSSKDIPLDPCRDQIIVEGKVPPYIPYIPKTTVAQDCKPNIAMITKEAMKVLEYNMHFVRLAHLNLPPDTRSPFRKWLDRNKWKVTDYLGNLWDAIKGKRHDEEDW